MGFDVFGEDLQRAALEPDRWPDLLHRISHSAGALGAILISETHRLPVSPVSRDLLPLMDRYYAEGWNTRDVRFRGIDRALRAGAVTDGEILSAEEMSASPYYQELLRPEGCLWFCSLPFSAAGASWFLTLQRTIGQGPFSPDEVAQLKTLRRPLDAAASLSHALSYARVSGMSDAFDRLTRPALVLDERGALIRCSTGAEKLLAGLAGLRHGEITFHDGTNQRSFEAALAQAEPSIQWSQQAHTRTALRDGAGRTWDVEATALGDWARYSFTQARYLVLFDEIRKDPSTAARWQAQHGLTPAEARVAESLVGGLSLRATADQLAITYETARTHLKSILSKTGSRRQGELVSLLLRGQAG